MNLRWYILIILLIHSFGIYSQTLKRRAFIGIVMSEIPDSVKSRNLKMDGVYVDYVFPNSTAGHAQLSKGMVLNQINGIPIKLKSDAVKIMENIRDGDLIEIDCFFKGLTFTKVVRAVGRPLEDSKYADVRYSYIDFEGCKLRTILYTPKGKVNCPVVFFLQGYSCSSVEYPFYKSSPFLRFFEDLVKSGYAVYRLEKAGVGDSEDFFDCMQMGFYSECSAFKEAYRSLIKNPKIDSASIFLFGHSLGGIMAPMLAEEYSPKGIIAYGAIVDSWFEYLINVKRIQGDIWRRSEIQTSKKMRGFIPFWYDLLIEKKNGQEIFKNWNHKNFLAEQGLLEDFKNGYYMDRSLVFWQELNEIDICNKWGNLTTNVLCLHGELDIQALNERWAHVITNITSLNSQCKTDLEILPNTDHGFVYFADMDENTRILSLNGYHSYSLKNYSSIVAKTAINWMETVRRN